MVGHSSLTVRRNRTSAAVSSCEASETKTTAWAWGRDPTVTELCTDPRPPTPGVSTRVSPEASSGRSSPTVTDRSRRWFPGFPLSVTYAAISPTGTSSVHGDASPPAADSKLATARTCCE